MSRRAKGPRLYWKERPGQPSVWEIRDGTTRISTGTDDIKGAEAALVAYIDKKHRPRGPVGPQELSVSMCLVLYAEGHAVNVTDPARIGYAMDVLVAFWKDLPVSAITDITCKAYVDERRTKFGKPASHGTTRRELGVLQAALTYCHRKGKLTSPVTVTLPAKPEPRERWLTRQEAAWLIRGARSLRVDGRHIADFILHALYTGSRKATILAMHFDTPSFSGGHVDTITGVLYRKPMGKRSTAKKQNPARIPARYLAHLRRQAKRGRKYIVEDYRGNRVGDIKHGWSNCISRAMELAAKKEIILDLTDVTPHILKHTAITWALQKGATLWDAAGYFSTSMETLEKVYAHHSPDHQKTAVEAMNRRR